MRTPQPCPPCPALFTALALAMTVTTAARAQTPTPLMPTAETHATNAASSNTSATRDGRDEDGNLTVELVGGTAGALTGLALGIGAAHTLVSCEGDDDTFGCAMTGGAIVGTTFLLTAPLFTTLFVDALGDATGGNGKLGSAMAGAGFGTFIGGLLGAGVFAVSAEHEDFQAAGAIGGMALLLAGPAVGAVVGYRWSSNAPVQAVALPTLDGRGMLLNVSGAL